MIKLIQSFMIVIVVMLILLAFGMMMAAIVKLLNLALVSVAIIFMAIWMLVYFVHSDH